MAKGHSMDGYMVTEHVTPHPQILLTDNPLNGSDILNVPKLKKNSQLQLLLITIAKAKRVDADSFYYSFIANMRKQKSALAISRCVIVMV